MKRAHPSEARHRVSITMVRLERRGRRRHLGAERMWPPLERRGLAGAHPGGLRVTKAGSSDSCCSLPWAVMGLYRKKNLTKQLCLIVKRQHGGAQQRYFFFSIVCIVFLLPYHKHQWLGHPLACLSSGFSLCWRRGSGLCPTPQR